MAAALSYMVLGSLRNKLQNELGTKLFSVSECEELQREQHMCKHCTPCFISLDAKQMHKSWHNLSEVAPINGTCGYSMHE